MRAMEEENEQNNQEKHEYQKKITVPTQYRQAAKILKQIVEDGKSMKELVYNNKHIVGYIFAHCSLLYTILN